MAEEVQYIVDHSGASVLLVDPELDDALASVTAKERIVLDGRADRELFAEAPPGRYPQRLGGATRTVTASINYTSGTTARPKGVQLTHRNCWLNAAIFGWHATRHRPGRLPAHPAHVPLQRLGHALRRYGHGLPTGRAAQSGR